jgi:hypothetical protein
MNLGIGISLHLQSDPTFPEAKRGHVIPPDQTPRATDEQLALGLIWWPCSFCHSWVLVDSTRRARERCSCGARRCHHTSRDGYYSEGWRRDGKTWWFC